MKEQLGFNNYVLTTSVTKEWGILLIRAVICLFFCAAAISVFFSGNKEEAWILPNSYIDARIIAVFAFITGVLILCGLFTYQAAITAGILILILVVEHLVKNSFYNFSAQLFPLLLFIIAVLYLNRDYNKISIDQIIKRAPTNQVNANSWAVLLLRVFLGAIFLTQGLNNIIKVGVVTFAQKIYVAPFAESWVPQSLLWIAGVLNPPVQLLGGIALILGFMTRFTSLGIGVFLISIIFGHMIQAPFEDIHDFGVANFIAVLGIIYLESQGNRFSLDYILGKRGTDENLLTS